jgi:hypothetical protein
MKRDYWFHKEENLLVEKYSKIVNKDDFDQFNGALYNELDKNQTMLTLIDVSDATLFNIDYGQISSLFKEFLGRVGEDNKMNVAIFHGLNDKDDYLKISAFSKYESDSIQIKNFIELRDAFDWLNTNETVRDKIRLQLRREN